MFLQPVAAKIIMMYYPGTTGGYPCTSGKKESGQKETSTMFDVVLCCAVLCHLGKEHGLVTFVHARCCSSQSIVMEE